MAALLQTLDWEFRVATAALQSHAFSLPLGTIIINEKLLDLLRTDDQLAFVIAHEMAHLMARHAGESVSRCVIAARTTGAAIATHGFASATRCAYGEVQSAHICSTGSFAAARCMQEYVLDNARDVPAGARWRGRGRPHGATLPASAVRSHARV